MVLTQATWGHQNCVCQIYSSLTWQCYSHKPFENIKIIITLHLNWVQILDAFLEFEDLICFWLIFLLETQFNGLFHASFDTSNSFNALTSLRKKNNIEVNKKNKNVEVKLQQHFKVNKCNKMFDMVTMCYSFFAYLIYNWCCRRKGQDVQCSRLGKFTPTAEMSSTWFNHVKRQPSSRALCPVVSATLTRQP